MPTTTTLSSKRKISIPKAVQEFLIIPKGSGVLMIPVPQLRQLAGITKGACKDGLRDRNDRY
jgi:hypothetical protein